jgi:hypothetical protein
MKPTGPLKMKKTFFLILIMALSGTVSARIFGPSNYEDCVLDGVKSAKTNQAVNAIVTMCSSKFDSSSAKPEQKKMVKCGKNKIDPNERANIKIDMADLIDTKHTIRIQRVAWESPYQYIKANEFVAYVQSSFPVSYSEINLNAFKDKSTTQIHGTYSCRGSGSPNVVSRFVCKNVDEKSTYWWRAQSILTDNVNVYEFMKQMGECDK